MFSKFPRKKFRKVLTCIMIMTKKHVVLTFSLHVIGDCYCTITDILGLSFVLYVDVWCLVLMHGAHFQLACFQSQSCR